MQNRQNILRFYTLRRIRNKHSQQTRSPILSLVNVRTIDFSVFNINQLQSLINRFNLASGILQAIGADIFVDDYFSFRFKSPFY